MNAQPIKLGEEKFKQEVKKVLNQQYLNGWSLGIKTSAKSIQSKLEGYNSDNVEEKIKDVLEWCEWALRTDDNEKNKPTV